MRWAGHTAQMDEMKNAYNFVVKPGGKRPVGECSCRWKDKMILQGMTMWTGFIWLRIETSGGLLWTW